MDQLTAYRILQIEPGCSQADIKAAYAALSKEYHPEEQPEEFQKIREAYVTLTRRNRNNQSASAEQEFRYVRIHETQERQSEGKESQTEGKESQTERQEERQSQRTEGKWNFNDALHQEEQERQADQQQRENQSHQNDQKWDFDSTLHQAEQNERERLFQTAQKALIEIEILLAPENRNKIKLFQRFFQKEEYQPVLKTPMFMGGFARMLVNTKLKKNIYDYIIDYYRFRGLNPNEMFSEAKALYRILDQKRGMNAKQKGNMAYVVPIAIFAAIRSVLRSADADTGFGVVVFAILVAMILIWLYRALYKNHSSLFAQAIVAVAVIASQFIVLVTDLYAPLLGYDNGIFVAALLLWLGIVWLGIVGIVALIQKILSAARRN